MGVGGGGGGGGGAEVVRAFFGPHLFTPLEQWGVDKRDRAHVNWISHLPIFNQILTAIWQVICTHTHIYVYYIYI